MSSEAIDTSAWDGYSSYTINASEVDEAVGDLVIDCSNFSDAWWEQVAADGRDIRVTNEAGDTAYSFHISEDFNTSTKIGRIWFNSVGLSTSANTVYRVYVGNAEATMPAVTDTLGRNNVWESDTKLYWSGDNAGATWVDLTGNGYDGTRNGSPSTTASGQIGTAATFSDSDYYTHFGVSLGNGVPTTISGWFKRTAGEPYVLSVCDASHAYKYNMLQARDNAIFHTRNTTPCFASGGVTAGWYHLAGAWVSSTERNLYVDGVGSTNTDNDGLGPNSTFDRFEVGRFGDLTPYQDPGSSFEGQHFRLDGAERSAEWASTHYNNESTPETFATYSSYSGEEVEEAGSNTAIITENSIMGPNLSWSRPSNGYDSSCDKNRNKGCYYGQPNSFSPSKRLLW